MSITVIETPAVVAPIGNEILVKLQTDNRLSTPGSAASLVFTFTGTDTTPGHTFVMAYGIVSLQFFLAAVPDDSGNQIRCATGGQPVDYWMAQFAEDLMRNYYLKRDFDCVVDTSNDIITLTAKESGIDFNFTLSFNNLSYVALADIDGVDPVYRENYEILCLTELFDGSAWRKLAEDRLAPDAENQAMFYPQDLMVAEHTWPEEPATYHALRQNHIKPYRLSYAELYDDNVRRLSAPASYRAILGGFDYKMVAALNGVDYSLLDFLTTYKSFLTWQPVSKIINRTQPEKLYFLVYNDIASIELHIKLYFDDDTDSGDQELATITGVSQYQVYEFMIGYSQLDLSKWSDKTVEKYEIWLEDDAGNAQSQVRTFVLDTKTYRHERIFLFRNSFGGFDTLRATGRKTQTNEIEKLLVEKNDRDININHAYQAFETQVFTINSGWISRETKNWLRELFLSLEIYEILDGFKYPIVITNDKNELFDDDTYLYDVKIEYRYNFKDKYFSGQLLETLLYLAADDGELITTDNSELIIV
jgi:hypothetical protein